MQKKVQIVSDGSLDLPQELTREKDIEVVPFYVSFDSETYKKEVVEIGIRDFYQELRVIPNLSTALKTETGAALPLSLLPERARALRFILLFIIIYACNITIIR